MATKIQMRRGTEAEWIAIDPILAEGELAVSLDVLQFKVGDGVLNWSDLDYQVGPPGADGVGVPVGGTTGQVLAKASEDYFDTEWVDQSGGGGGTIGLIASTDFSVIARYQTSNSGTRSLVVQSNGLVFVVGSGGATGSQWVGWDIIGGTSNTGNNLNVGSPIFTCHIANPGSYSSDFEFFAGLGDLQMDSNGINWVGRHIGFKIKRVAGGAWSIYGSIGNASSETVTGIIDTFGSYVGLDLILKVNGTTSVDFYVRKSNGELSAPQTITMSIPTVSGSCSFQLSSAGVNGTMSICVDSASYQRS